ncbi:IclR family transcriptional regulator [Ruegeria marisrubri]|uniref:IclR family transcriptional regulator n=1 Tax=Ruegeria marisrubri TaxID=1685379 RepID=A0A0X3U7N7_9RHOB|nr:IclR family transcriptional regulator [Ruegeria marisrubri]KUJ82726.1 IclR family transcriptional regulator [Ruegeria marisrubri]
MAKDSEIDRKSPDYLVQPVIRALAVLRHIAAGNRCRNSSRTAKAIGINRTTLIRLLATLEKERIIETLPDEGGYRLGTGLISLASEALNERGIIQVARPVLKMLVDKLNLSAHLGVREGREIVYLARETPVSHLASTVREGTRLAAHATTIGRILLSELSREELVELYRSTPLEAFTEKTRTTLEDLAKQLEDDRSRGYSWSVANFEPEIGSAAAPVYDHRGEAVAAINVTGHASLFATPSENAERIASALKSAAQEISEGIGFRGWAADQM